MNRRPFPLLDELPDELRDVILDFHWDQTLLWALALPVIEVSVAELEWHLHLPLWARDGRPFGRNSTPLRSGDDERPSGRNKWCARRVGWGYDC